MDHIFCTGCGKELPVHVNFCIVCGKKAVAKVIPLSEDSKNICKNCGMPHAAAASFCKGCGFIITKPESPKPDRNICVYCGMQVSPKAVFCIGCGNKLPKEENITFNAVNLILNPAEDNKPITNKNKILNAEQIMPSAKPAEVISDIKPDEQISNNTIREISAGRTLRQSVRKPVRRFTKLPVVISIFVLTGFICVLTAYFFGWLKNPFDKPIPYDPEKSVYGSDMGDWQNYPDLKKEQATIAKRQKQLITYLEKNNIEKAVKYLYPDYQSGWQKQMEDDPEGTAALAAVLSTAEMTFLGKNDPPKENPESRTATFLVEYEQSGFYITWLKSDGIWYLYDF